MRSQLSNEEAKLFFTLRSHPVRGIKANFSFGNKENIYCPLKSDTSPMIDEHIYLLVCKTICSSLSISQLEELRMTKYEDIYGTKYKQKEAVIVFGRLLQLRKKLLEHLKTLPPAASANTLHNFMAAADSAVVLFAEFLRDITS